MWDQNSQNEEQIHLPTALQTTPGTVDFETAPVYNVSTTIAAVDLGYKIPAKFQNLWLSTPDSLVMKFGFPFPPIQSRNKDHLLCRLSPVSMQYEGIHRLRKEHKVNCFERLSV